MKQSNEYAKSVMGAEKYDKWAKMTVGVEGISWLQHLDGSQQSAFSE